MLNLNKINNLTIVNNPKISIVSTKGMVIDPAKKILSSTPKVDVEIELSDCVRQCFNIRDIEFSNCYPQNLDEGAVFPHVKMAFEKINENIANVAHDLNEVSISGKHKSRIEKILKKYIDESDFDSQSDFIYKSDIRVGVLLSDRGAFRVISIYFFEPSTTPDMKSSHRLIVLFFDPYHLFIPSSDYGTAIYGDVSHYTGDCRLLKY